MFSRGRGGAARTTAARCQPARPPAPAARPAKFIRVYNTERSLVTVRHRSDRPAPAARPPPCTGPLGGASARAARRAAYGRSRRAGPFRAPPPPVNGTADTPRPSVPRERERMRERERERGGESEHKSVSVLAEGASEWERVVVSKAAEQKDRERGQWARGGADPRPGPETLRRVAGASRPGPAQGCEGQIGPPGAGVCVCVCVCVCVSQCVCVCARASVWGRVGTWASPDAEGASAGGGRGGPGTGSAEGPGAAWGGPVGRGGAQAAARRRARWVRLQERATAGRGCRRGSDASRPPARAARTRRASTAVTEAVTEAVADAEAVAEAVAAGEGRRDGVRGWGWRRRGSSAACRCGGRG